MNAITSKAMAKVAVVATGLAMATSMLSLAPIAHAATCSISSNLTIGSSGAEVTCLQQSLIAAGYSIPAGATGYFGAQTQAAVKMWQAAAGVSPAAGYFGPISRAAWNLSSGSTGSTGGSTVPGCAPGALFSSTTGQSCAGSVSTVPGCTAGALFSSTTGQACGGSTSTSGPLAGTDGSISDVNELGTYNNEDAGEGESAVKVLGAEIEASNDGDIALRSVKVSFDSTGNTASDNLDDYIEGVSVWLGNTKVGSADVSDFNEDSSVLSSKTITLSNAVIRAGDTANLYVAVDVVGNLDSGDIGAADSWTVDIENIRFEDGSGVVSTDTTTGDIDGMDVPVNFVDFGTAANTELKLSTASDSPEAGVVIIDDTLNTDDVSLLKGKLQLDGSSDVVIDEFPVTFTTVGGSNVAAVTGAVTLKLGSNTYSETVSITGATTGTVTFDNLNFSMNAGDSVNFEVLADINDVDAGTLDEGDTLTASVTSTNRDYMDVEDEAGDQLADSGEKSGTTTGEAQEFRTSGISLSLVSTATSISAGNSANDDTGSFTIKFKITAVGDAVYISSLSDSALAADDDGSITALVDRAGTATVGGVSVVLVNTTDTDLNAAGLYLIEEGSSETFELTSSVQLPAAGAAGLFRAVLGEVSWTTDSTDPTPDNSYTSNLDTFKTSYISLN